MRRLIAVLAALLIVALGGVAFQQYRAVQQAKLEYRRNLAQMQRQHAAMNYAQARLRHTADNAFVPKSSDDSQGEFSAFEETVIATPETFEASSPVAQVDASPDWHGISVAQVEEHESVRREPGNHEETPFRPGPPSHEDISSSRAYHGQVEVEVKERPIGRPASVHSRVREAPVAAPRNPGEGDPEIRELSRRLRAVQEAAGRRHDAGERE